MTERGRLIALEGVDATGKSTQARLLGERLGALVTHEPGGTPIGARIRELLLDREVAHLDARAEALLMAADRAQHVAEVVRPALLAGRDVVTDRYLHSSVAYQGYGRGLDPDEVFRISMFATGGLLPDVVVLLDVPADVAESRLDPAPDRIEAEGASFREVVADAYRRLAAADPDRWVVVDASGHVGDVARRVWDAVSGRLSR